MCEQTYVGCPQCGRRADSEEVYQREYVTETIRYVLDEDGDVNHNAETIYGEDHSYEGAGYVCDCGWEGHSLDPEQIDEGCECNECVEPDPEDEGEDPWELVLLSRVERVHYPHSQDDWPLEARILYRDRANWCMAIPRWRLAELWESDWSGLNVHVTHDFTDSIPPSAEALAPGYDHDERKVLTA